MRHSDHSLLEADRHWCSDRQIGEHAKETIFVRVVLAKRLAVCDLVYGQHHRMIEHAGQQVGAEEQTEVGLDLTDEVEREELKEYHGRDLPLEVRVHLHQLLDLRILGEYQFPSSRVRLIGVGPTEILTRYVVSHFDRGLVVLFASGEKRNRLELVTNGILVGFVEVDSKL